MSELERAAVGAANDLTELGAQWALVGALAVSAYSETRFTRDVDIAVSVASDRAAERLVRGLVARGYRVLAVLENQRTQAMATVRLATPGVLPVALDLLFAQTGLEGDIVASARSEEIGFSRPFRVARREHLIAMKVIAVANRNRATDAEDLRGLVSEASGDEVMSAYELIARVEGSPANRLAEVLTAAVAIRREPA